MWTFYDFLEDGENVIEQWLESFHGRDGKRIRARLGTKVGFLTQAPRDDWGDIIGPLTGDGWDKIFELRMTLGRIQYRPLLCYGPGEMALTFLAGATEVNNRIEPPGVQRLVQQRRRVIEGLGGNEHVVAHDIA